MFQFNIFNLKFVAIQILLSLCLFSILYAQVNKKPLPKNPKPSNIVLTAREIANKVLPSTVLIITQDENGEIVAQGSGFVYRAGLIATNLHIFDRATQAYVKFVGKDTSYKVEEVIGINPRQDLCVVRISDTQTLPLPISSLPQNEIGDDIYVASNPKGLEGSFSKGIISASRKNVGLIQIDAAISPGSSGGAVLNNRGEVIGMVVSSVTTGQNLNFAIPIEYLTNLKLEFKEPVTTAGAFAFNDRQREDLNGFVESVVESTAEFEYNSNADIFLEGTPELSEKNYFNQFGNNVSKTIYQNGQVTMSIQKSYDNEGFMRRRIIESDSSFIGGKKYPATEENFSVIESIKSENDNRRFSGAISDTAATQVYDRNGKLIEMTICNSKCDSKTSHQSILRSVYSYGKNGFVSEESLYGFEKLRSITRYSYQVDEQGNWIKRVSSRMYSNLSELGFVLNSVTYRKINYFSE